MFLSKFLGGVVPFDGSPSVVLSKFLDAVVPDDGSPTFVFGKLAGFVVPNGRFRRCPAEAQRVVAVGVRPGEVRRVAIMAEKREGDAVLGW